MTTIMLCVNHLLTVSLLSSGLIAIQVSGDLGLVRSSDQSAALLHAGPTPPNDLLCEDNWQTFHLSACALCYGVLFGDSTELRLQDNYRIVSTSGGLLPEGSAVIPDVNNETVVDLICDVIGDRNKCHQWQACCRKAEGCCQKLQGDVSTSAIGHNDAIPERCPALWDGYSCWPRTRSGDLTYQKCPDYVSGYNTSAYVSRLCSPDGTWHRANGDRTWTDYGGCKTKEARSEEAQKLITSGSEVTDPEPVQCRYWGGYADRATYEMVTCSHCYKYLYPDGTELVPYGIYLVSVNGTVVPHGTFLPADVSNSTLTKLICRTLKSKVSCSQWLECCAGARQCCDAQLADVSMAVIGRDDPEWCPSTWDGYACWPRTKAGTDEMTSCPAYIPHALPSAYAIKTCTENGTWFRSYSSKEWTNYTACLRVDELKMNIYIKVACNSLSLFVLIPSMVIFLSYRSLRNQHRVRLHINLFASFILYSSINILWEMLVVYDRMSKHSTSSRMAANTPGCRFLYVLTRYSRSTNFLWMFCEGLYLHRLIVKAFQPPSKLTLFYVSGWMFPWLPVGVYSILRLFMKNESCWVQNIGAYEWMIYIPNLVALLANLVFLIDILRILLTQLQSHPNEPSNYRRALKATFVLVPLFGLQLFVVIYRPPLGSRAGIIYENIAAFVVNSQGFFVAVIFCLLNGEVLTNLRRSCIRLGCYKADLLARNGNYTMTTQASDGYPRDSPTSSFRTADNNAGKRKDYIALKPIHNNNGNLN